MALVLFVKNSKFQSFDFSVHKLHINACLNYVSAKFFLCVSVKKISISYIVIFTNKNSVQRVNIQSGLNKYFKILSQTNHKGVEEDHFTRNSVSSIGTLLFSKCHSSDSAHLVSTRKSMVVSARAGNTVLYHLMASKRPRPLFIFSAMSMYQDVPRAYITSLTIAWSRLHILLKRIHHH